MITVTYRRRPTLTVQAPVFSQHLLWSKNNPDQLLYHHNNFQNNPAILLARKSLCANRARRTSVKLRRANRVSAV